MLNWKPRDPSMYRDVQTIYNFSHSNQNLSPRDRLKKLWRSSRDSARTPVQWSAEKNAGFTDGDTTWMAVNENYKQINVAQQEEDPDSILNFYRRAIALRKKLSCVRDGDYREYRKHSGKVYMYSRQNQRQKILVVCSFSKKKTAFRAPKGFYIPGARLALCNYDKIKTNTLQPYECRVYLWK